MLLIEYANKSEVSWSHFDEKFIQTPCPFLTRINDHFSPGERARLGSQTTNVIKLMRKRNKFICSFNDILTSELSELDNHMATVSSDVEIECTH